jgi:copper transport protein
MRRRRAIILVALVVALVGGPATKASAHTYFKSSDPPQGAVLATAPKQARLTFSEKISKELSQVTLVDENGTTLPVTFVVDPADNHSLVVALPSLSDGAYRLRYATRDTVDLHETSGSIVFAIGSAARLLPVEDSVPGPAVIVVALQFLALAALAAVIGPLTVALFALSTTAGATRARLVQWAGRAAVLAVGVQVLLLVVEATLIDAPFGRTIRSLLTASDYGRRLIAFALVAIGLAVLLPPLAAALRSGRPVPIRAPEVLAAIVLAPGLAIVEAFAGHNSGRSFIGGVILRAVHLLGASVWIGGLATIVVLSRGATDTRAVIRRFAPIAVGATGALIVTGLVLSGREVTSLTALFSTQFGWTLVVKLALLAVALYLGLRNAHRAELLVALGVLVGGAALASTAPALGARYLPASQTSVVPPTVQGEDDIIAELSIQPGRPGTNLVSVSVASSRRPQPDNVTRVTARLTLPDGSVTALNGTPAGYGTPLDLGTVTIPSPGAVKATLTFERPARPLGELHYDATIAPLEPARHKPIVSSRRIEPIVNTLAVIAGLALVGAGLWVRRRRTGGRSGQLDGLDVDLELPVGG